MNLRHRQLLVITAMSGLAVLGIGYGSESLSSPHQPRGEGDSDSTMVTSTAGIAAAPPKSDVTQLSGSPKIARRRGKAPDEDGGRASRDTGRPRRARRRVARPKNNGRGDQKKVQAAQQRWEAAKRRMARSNLAP